MDFPDVCHDSLCSSVMCLDVIVSCRISHNASGLSVPTCLVQSHFAIHLTDPDAYMFCHYLGILTYFPNIKLATTDRRFTTNPVSVLLVGIVPMHARTYLSMYLDTYLYTF